MAHAVYFLCALTSVVCTILLLKAHRTTHSSILFWSGLCFIALALNNLFLLGDLVFAPEIDFAIPRNLCGALGVGLLLYGLLWRRRDEEE